MEGKLKRKRTKRHCSQLQILQIAFTLESAPGHAISAGIRTENWTAKLALGHKKTLVMDPNFPLSLQSHLSPNNSVSVSISFCVCDGDSTSN